MAQGFMTPKAAAVAIVSHTTGRGPVNGSFATALIEAFIKADRMNHNRLLVGFPEFTEPRRIVLAHGEDELEKLIEEGYFDNL